MFRNSKNVIFDILDKITDTVFLSLVFLLFSIPVFTIGASMTALYYTVNKVQRHSRGYMWQEFTGAFRRNFRQATLTWLLFLAVFAVLGGDLYYVLKVMPPSPAGAFLNVLFIVLLVLLVTLCGYVFPYTARFQDTIRVTIKNCALIALLNLPATLLLLLLLAGSGLLIWLFFPLAIIVPAGSAYFQGEILEKVFRKYMSDEDREKEDIADL